MSALRLIRELYAHQEWADAAVWRTVLTLGGEDEKLREKLHHLHLVQRIHANIWRDEVPNIVGIDAFENLRALALWAREGHRQIASVIDDLDDAVLARTTAMPWRAMIEESLGRAAVAPDLAQSLVHIAMHSAYHRGQVNTRIRELGGTPPMVDFVYWVWMGMPVAEWVE